MILVDSDINAVVESRAMDDNPEFVRLYKKYKQSKTSVAVDTHLEGIRSVAYHERSCDMCSKTIMVVEKN